MPFCAIQCPNCGSISCREHGDTYICESCDTRFIWKDNTAASIVNKSSDPVLASLNSCTNALDTLYGDEIDGDYETLQNIGHKYQEILEQRPDCWQAYWGLVRVFTVNFHDDDITKSEFNEAESCLKKALRFASVKYPDDVAYMKRKWQDYVSGVMKLFDETEKQRDELQGEYDELVGQYETMSVSYNTKRGRLAQAQHKLEKYKQKFMSSFKLMAKVLVVSIIIVVAIGLFNRELAGKLTTIGRFVYICARRVEFTVTSLQLQKQLDQERGLLDKYRESISEYLDGLDEFDEKLS